MPKKFADLDPDEKRNLEDQLSGVSASLGMDAWESYGGKDSLLKDQIGMCHNCKSLSYCKTEFDTVHAICDAFKFKLSGQNRITECNLHSPNGVITLTDMFAMATLIDPKEVKTEGFISTDPRLLGKPKPKNLIGKP